MTEPAAPTFPSPEELADLLPQYVVEEKVFAGRLSAVYLARQPALDRYVMIRIMAEPEPAEVSRLMDRLRNRARLVHPKIISIYDFGRTSSGMLYLITEHVHGALLDALIREKEVTPKRAFQLAIQLCEALQLVHNNGLPHGALTAAAVLVTKDWQIKLTGVGMAQAEDAELTWLRESAGTQAEDIAALGNLIHEMFSGESPGPQGEVSRVLPRAFGAVVSRCVGPESECYASPDEVRAALNEALRTEQQVAGAVRRTVIGPAGKAAAAPTPTPAVAPPPIIARGAPPPAGRSARQPVRFFQRLDTLFWAVVRTSLHLFIVLVTVLILAAIFLLKDRIVFERDDEDGSAPAAPAPAAPGPPMASSTPEPVVTPTPTTAPAPVPPPAAPSMAVTPPPAADPVAVLDNQYRQAIQNEAAYALEGVQLKEMPFLQRELQRLQRGDPLPLVDEPDLPPRLKMMREKYREERAKLGK